MSSSLVVPIVGAPSVTLYRNDGTYRAPGVHRPRQPDPGTQPGCYRCSLPGLTGFTTSRREGADTDCHG